MLVPILLISGVHLLDTCTKGWRVLCDIELVVGVVCRVVEHLHRQTLCLYQFLHLDLAIYQSTLCKLQFFNLEIIS